MIVTFSLRSLTNETHFQHKTEIRDILQGYPDIVTALEGIVKSDKTRLINEKDRARDETTTGLFRHIDADCYHFDPGLRAGAIGL